MQQADFSRLLDLATADAIALAKMMLLDELSDQYVYRIFPNQSFDGNRDAEEIVYPMDSLGSIDDYIMMTRDECISFMYREGRLPEWIDISVGAAGADLTYIDCRCCGRFTDNDQRLYYNRTGRGPFGIKSPTLPNWILPGEKIPKFRLADTAD